MEDTLVSSLESSLSDGASIGAGDSLLVGSPVFPRVGSSGSPDEDLLSCLKIESISANASAGLSRFTEFNFATSEATFLLSALFAEDFPSFETVCLLPFSALQPLLFLE